MSKIKLSDHFTVPRLLRFTLPSIAMMIFTSVYGVVDGIFVSNFAGKTAFSAVNFIMPYVMVFGAVGFLLGAGGTALISMYLGMGKREKANRLFSALVLIGAACGVVLTVVSIAFMRPVAIWMGAEGQMLSDCVLYGTIVQLALTAYALQFAFQSFCVAAEKPNLSLIMTLVSGFGNIIGDAVLVSLFRWGLVGAAVATACSQVLGALIPIVYFLRPNSSLLRLVKPEFNGKDIFRVVTNGSSELVTNISMSLVGILYNFQLMRYAGEDGIAAYGTIMYVNFIFVAMFIGFSVGSAPIVGFHHGAGNHSELKSLLRKSLLILGILSVCMTLAGELLAAPLSGIFVGYDKALYQMTLRGFTIYSFSFLVCGFNIYGSAFFTALNNGLISAVISFARTLVFQIAAVLILPVFIELDGIWSSILVSELAALMLTAFFTFLFRKKYHYI